MLNSNDWLNLYFVNLTWHRVSRLKINRHECGSDSGDVRRSLCKIVKVLIMHSIIFLQSLSSVNVTF